MFSHLQRVDFKTNFKVKCKDVIGSKTLTLNKRYIVTQLGFNGFFKIKGDTGRKVWHNPKRFDVVKINK
jgi:hypothetical protein